VALADGRGMLAPEAARNDSLVALWNGFPVRGGTPPLHDSAATREASRRKTGRQNTAVSALVVKGV